MGRIDGYPHIDVGSLFRQAMKKDRDFAEVARPYINRGQLVPSDVALRLIFNRIDQLDCQRGFIIDGSSRNLELASALCKYLQPRFQFFAVLIETADNTVIQRIQGRRLCQHCNATCNISYEVSDMDPTCPRCGGSLDQRPDDSPEVVKVRLREYYQTAESVLQFYEGQQKLIVVNGNHDPNQVHRAIVEKIQAFTAH